MLRLPISPADALTHIIGPALEILPERMDSVEARVQLLGTALQESGLKHRWQIVDRKRPNVKGPARGLLQFERAGGVVGVLRHAATHALAVQVCEARGVLPTDIAVYAAIERDDILAFCFGRLLLWTDPYRLPPRGAVEEAWQLYLRTWRPGRPHHHTWAENYSTALQTVLA